jgi:hypothetical protein
VRRFPIGPVLRHVEELYQPTIARESAVRLAEARVVLADYALLQADFPYLSTPALLRAHPDLEQLDPAQRQQAIHARIDAWLLEHAAVISGRQTVPNNVNTAIAVTDARVDVARPPRYGRALVVPIPGGGLLDIKGAGVADGAMAQRFVHQTGLMFLGEALADWAYQRVIDRMLRHAESACASLPTYAVLSLGFGIHSDPGILPAGMQVRRAHRRPLMGGDLPGGGTACQRIKFEIEMILRHFGVTSCNSVTTIERTIDESGERRYGYGGQAMTGYTPEQLQAIESLLGSEFDRFEGVNIQILREFSIEPASAQIVDFGHYEVRRRFEQPVVSLVNDRLARWGGALRPNHPHFVQPDPELLLPLDEWEVHPEGVRLPGLPGTSRQAGVDQLCFALADAFAKDKSDRSEVIQSFEAIIARATAAWWTQEPST